VTASDNLAAFRLAVACSIRTLDRRLLFAIGPSPRRRPVVTADAAVLAPLQLTMNLHRVLPVEEVEPIAQALDVEKASESLRESTSPQPSSSARLISLGASETPRILRYSTISNGPIDHVSALVEPDAENFILVPSEPNQQVNNVSHRRHADSIHAGPRPPRPMRPRAPTAPSP
jgi:hypothetical protein